EQGADFEIEHGLSGGTGPFDRGPLAEGDNVRLGDGLAFTPRQTDEDEDDDGGRQKFPRHDERVAWAGGCLLGRMNRGNVRFCAEGVFIRAFRGWVESLV